MPPGRPAMATSSAHRVRCAPGRRTRIAVSGLVAAATLTLVASTGGAAHAAAPRSAAGATYRVLSTVTTMSRDPAARTSELQYVTPHARYRLFHSYEGNRLQDSVWQEDAPQGKCRLDNRVVINPGPKDWLEKRTIFAPLPPPAFGIRSTAEQVAAAIRDGKAPGGTDQKEQAEGPPAHDRDQGRSFGKPTSLGQPGHRPAGRRNRDLRPWPRP